MFLVSCGTSNDKNSNQKFVPSKQDISNLQESLEEDIPLEDTSNKTAKLNHEKTGIKNEINFNDLNETLGDECKIADSLRKSIVIYLKTSILPLPKNNFLLYLKSNSELNNRSCFFPRNSDELLLLYKFTDILEKRTHNDKWAIEIIIYLNLYMSRAIEYMEHLQDVIPRIALNNTYGFVQEVSKLGLSDQKKILENLEYLENLEAIKELRSNLKELDTSTFQTTVSLANESIYGVFEE